MKRKSGRDFLKDHCIYNAYICSKILRKVLQMTTNIHASLIHVLLGLHEDDCYKKVKKCYNSVLSLKLLINVRRLKSGFGLWLRKAIFLVQEGLLLPFLACRYAWSISTKAITNKISPEEILQTAL